MDKLSQRPPIELRKSERGLLDFYYLSFRFSQGSPDIQHSFFKWAASVNKFVNVSVNMPDNLEKSSLPALHKSVSPLRVSSEFGDQWDKMLQFLAVKPPLSPLTYIKSITYQIMVKDLEYQTKERPGRTLRNQEADSQKDVFASYIRKYAVFGHETGSPHFNEMFIYVKNEISSDTYNGTLNRLARKWEENHLGLNFFPDKWRTVMPHKRF